MAENDPPFFYILSHLFFIAPPKQCHKSTKLQGEWVLIRKENEKKKNIMKELISTGINM